MENRLHSELIFQIFFLSLVILGSLHPVSSLLDFRGLERFLRSLNVSSSAAPFTKIGKTDFLDLAAPERIVFKKNDESTQTLTFQEIVQMWQAPHFVHISGIYPLYLYLDYPNQRTEKYLKFRICTLVSGTQSIRVQFPLKKGAREYELSCSE